MLFSAFFRNYANVDVQTGILRLNGSPTHELNGGNYNISGGSEFQLQGFTLLSGSLQGNIDGIMVNTGTIEVPGTASIDLLGNGFSWESGLFKVAEH